MQNTKYNNMTEKTNFNSDVRKECFVEFLQLQGNFNFMFIMNQNEDKDTTLCLLFMREGIILYDSPF